jgi:hypothetical protein
MKSLQKALLSAVVLLITSTAFGQKIHLKDGDKTVLKNENVINIEFTFDNLRVGKYNKEDEYIAAKKEEYNKKEPGRGDTWASRWKDDQQTRFPADFVNLFTKNASMTTSKDAKYTMIVHTTFIEPGFYTPIAFVRKYANINADISIVETANKNKSVASFTIENSPGRSAIDIADFDTGQRISEAYAKAGKELGKYLK